MKNTNLILGINDSLDCGATITKGNRILCSINEERINRKKLCHGFPTDSILSSLKVSKIKSEDIKVVAVAGISRVTKNLTPYNNLLHENNKKESLKQIHEQIHEITKLTLLKLSSVQINDQEIKDSVANAQLGVKH